MRRAGRRRLRGEASAARSLTLAVRVQRTRSGRALRRGPGAGPGGPARTRASALLKAHTGAELERAGTAGAERLVDPLGRLAEGEGLGGRVGALGIERKRVATQVRDVEGVEDLAEDAQLAALLDLDHLGES